MRCAFLRFLLVFILSGRWTGQAATTTTEETYVTEIEHNELPVWLTDMQKWMIREMEGTRPLPHEVAGAVVNFFDALPSRTKETWTNIYRQCVNQAAQICDLEFLQHDIRITESCGRLDACARLFWKLEDCEERLMAERSSQVPFFHGHCKVLWDLQRNAVDFLEAQRRLSPLSIAQMSALLEIYNKGETLTAENAMFLLGEPSYNKHYLSEISMALKRFRRISPLAKNKILAEQFVLPISELITSKKYKIENCLEELRRIAGNETVGKIERLRKDGRTTEIGALINEYSSVLEKELHDYPYQMQPIKVFEMHGGCKPLWFEYAGKRDEEWFEWLSEEQRDEVRLLRDLNWHKEIRGWHDVHNFLLEIFENRSQYEKKKLLPMYSLI